MKTRELQIEHLQLTLPRSQGPLRQHDADMLAKSVAANLADAFKQGRLSEGADSIANLKIQVPRDQVNGSGISRAIQASLRHPFSNGKKER